jgi:hypothetical protein
MTTQERVLFKSSVVLILDPELRLVRMRRA